MRLGKFLVGFALLSAGVAQAASVAIIDSGVDYKHRDLVSKIWTNPQASTTDGDGKVYSQDTHGWNFADSNNQVIDYQYLGTFSADCPKFFDVQGKMQLGTATEEEKNWMSAHRADANFIKELQKFGNFVHGTHVSGISSVALTTAKLVGMKIIPTETPGQMLDAALKFSEEHPEVKSGAANNPLALMFLKMIAGRQATMLVTVGKYTAALHAGVANGSFGTSVHAAEPIVAGLLKNLIGHDPTPEETHDYTIYFVTEITTAMKAFPAASPQTFFVFAAGNDGTDNDALPASPANIKADNTIAVAATLGVQKLATFSNFGATMVEVAAPGVVINSTIPGDQYMALSGTSMAAPYVTNVAARVKESNDALTPGQIKQVLIGTVDVKVWLQGKVTSSGIVNPERAIHAALLTKTMSVTDAIGHSKVEVADVQDARKLDFDDSELFVMPLPSTL